MDRWVSDPGGQKRRLIDIHPEAVPAVLNAWKFSLAAGRRLTIREAKWAGRLYRVTDDAMVLANWAHHYAMQEVAAGAQTKDPDTSVSDANLTMTEMEFVAGLLQLKRIGRSKSSRKVLDPRAVKDAFDQLPPMDYDPVAARALMRHLSVRLADKVFENLGMREAFDTGRLGQPASTSRLASREGLLDQLPAEAGRRTQKGTRPAGTMRNPVGRVQRRAVGVRPLAFPAHGRSAMV